MTEKERKEFVGKLDTSIGYLEEAIGRIQRCYNPDPIDRICVHRLIVETTNLLFEVSKQNLETLINDRKTT